MIDVSVRFLAGEVMELKIPGSSLGREVRRMVSERLPARPGAKLVLHHGFSKLMLHQSLQEQGIQGKTALSGTFCRTDLYAAWSLVLGRTDPEVELALEGVTRIEGAQNGACLHNLPHGLQSLTLGAHFNESLEHVTLPTQLQSLTFGSDFNQPLQAVNLPRSLQSLTFRSDFNQDLKGVAFPSNLQSLTFGSDFNQKLQGVTLPRNLQNLAFGSTLTEAWRAWLGQATFSS